MRSNGQIEKVRGKVGVDGFKTLDKYYDPGLKQLFGQFSKVERQLMETELKGQPSLIFYYAVIKCWRRLKGKYKNMAVVADTFLESSNLKECYSEIYSSDKNIVNRKTVKNWRKELESRGIIKCHGYVDGGHLIEFIKERELNSSGYEEITKKMLLTDKLTLADKKFIISIVPFILNERDVIILNNREIAIATGYDEHTVGRIMRDFERRGIIAVNPTSSERLFNLTWLMTGLMDNYIEALARINELEDENLKLRRRIEMLERQLQALNDSKKNSLSEVLSTLIESVKNQVESNIAPEKLDEILLMIENKILSAVTDEKNKNIAGILIGLSDTELDELRELKEEGMEPFEIARETSFDLQEIESAWSII
ncbi:hypothetical protein [Fulvivirga marina]|nr:hypothetical protein [Fulvivirga marina]